MSDIVPEGSATAARPETALATPQTLPEVSIVSSATAAEGGALSFSISMDKVWHEDVWVLVEVESETAMRHDDYTVENPLSWFIIPAGQRSKAFVVKALYDKVDELDETFTVTVLQGKINYSIGNATAKGTIQNHAAAQSPTPPNISVGDVSIEEGDKLISIPVSLDKALEAGQYVYFEARLVQGSAVGGEDFKDLGTGTFTIDDVGESRSIVAVQMFADDDLEGDETFTLEIFNVKGATVADSAGTITIEDKPQPMVTIDDVTVAEGQQAVITVKLDRKTTKDVTVTWSTSNNTALDSGDYTGLSSQTLMIPAGQTSAAIVIQTSTDNVADDGESFYVNLNSATDANLSGSFGTATISESASTAPQVSINDIQVLEGGAARYTVSLDQAFTNGTIVTLNTSDGTAEAGSDYTAASNLEVLVPKGKQQVIAIVETLKDNVDEADETFTATLSNPIGGATLQDATGSATVRDAPVISISDAASTEGGTLSFTISLDKVWHTDVLIIVDVRQGSAKRHEDYSVTLNLDWFFIPAGQQSRNLEIKTIDDSNEEPEETFTVVLKTARIEYPFGDNIGKATITDDDGSSGLPQHSERQVAKDYSALIATVRGYSEETQYGIPHVDRWKKVLAAFGEDNGYTPMTAAQAQVMADTYSASRWDPVVEALTEIEAEAEASEADKVASTLPVVSIADATVVEGGQIEFAVSLDKAWSDDVTVVWSTSDGTALDGSDYTGKSSQTLTIQAGQQGGTITVQTTGDSLDEDSETFTVTLSSPTNATIGDGAGEGTVTDDDAAPVLSVNDVTVTEGGAAQFTIGLDAVSGKDVTVDWATSDGTAVSGSDYTAQASTPVTILAGQQSATVSVQTADDSDDEPGETFTVELSGAVNATVGDASGEATITDNDDPPPQGKYDALIETVRGYSLETQYGKPHTDRWKKVLAAFGEDNGYTPMTAAEAQAWADTYSASRWNPVVDALTEIEAKAEADKVASTLPVVSIADATVAEGGQTEFTVSLDKAWSDDVTLVWGTSDGTAADGSDYTGQSNQTLTIQAGQQSGTIAVQTTSDSIDEHNETFTVTLSGPANATIGDGVGAATISDDDAEPALSIGDVTVTEGGIAQFTIELDAVSGKDVTVNWSTADGTALSANDYTAQASTSVSILAGQQNVTVTVQTTDDGDDEPNETFTVELSGAVNASIGDGTGEATIEDNDDPPDPDPDPDPEPEEWDHNGLTLIGTEGSDRLGGRNKNDLLDGRGGEDMLRGGYGDDQITGGDGSDLFVVFGNCGHDVIMDFDPEEGDRFQFMLVGFSSFDEMIKDHAEEDGDDVLIYTGKSGKGDSVRLKDVGLDDLDASQFVIVPGNAPPAPSLDLLDVEQGSDLSRDHWHEVAASHMEIESFAF